MAFRPDLREAHYPIEVRATCAKCGLFLPVQFAKGAVETVSLCVCGHRSLVRKLAFAPRRIKISVRGMARLAAEAVLGKS